MARKKLKEFLVRLIYVEMLGHDGSFGYIKAVELCTSANILQKRVGYMTASLMLAPDHDFRFMLVNQVHHIFIFFTIFNSVFLSRCSLISPNRTAATGHGVLESAGMLGSAYCPVQTSDR